MRRIGSALGVLLASATLTALAPGNAFADPPSAYAEVWIDSWSSNYPTVCGRGDVNDGPTMLARWVFTVTGAVPADLWPIGYTQLNAAEDFFYCHTFYAGSPPDAAFTVTLTFAGLGVNTDVVGGAGLVYQWNSVVGHGNQVAFGTGG